MPQYQYQDDMNDGAGLRLTPEERTRSLRDENMALRELQGRGGSPFGWQSAARGGKGQLAQISKLMDYLYGQQGARFAQAESAQRKGLLAQRQGFANARSAVNRLGASAREGAVDRANVRTGQVQQDLINRGLYNSSAGPAYYDRAIQADLGSELQRLEESLAEMDSQLFLGEGQAEAAGQLGLSNLFQNRSRSETDLGMSWSEILSGLEHRDDDAANLGGLAGMLFGSIF